MKKLSLIILLNIFALSYQFSGKENKYSLEDKTIKVRDQNTEETRIQVALLLDTSSSMDGLIEQAKSCLWNIINTLTTLKYNGKTPVIEIALYEYGNSNLSEASKYIRQITPLTTDLDLLSETLFALKTNGGYEYCGAVINEAVKKLDWGNNPSDMKLIYIAGNEPFNQGNISYIEAISDALKKDIYVNTIYCGGYEEGIRGFWKEGADKGKGKYFTIDYNQKIKYIETPYDVRIQECDGKLNSTYIGYGKEGAAKQTNQIIQDRNALNISSSNYADRIVTKSKTVYKNDSWDLVDRVKEDEKAISKINKEDLPKELQNKTQQELKELVKEKIKQREEIQKEITELSQKREEYIDQEMKKTGEDIQEDLGNAINSSIIAFAKEKGYSLENK